MFRETYLAGRGKEERLYSQARFQSSVGFRIPSAVFRIPKPENPRFLKQNKFSDSGIRSPLKNAKLYCSWQSGGRGWGVRDLGSKFVWAFSQGEFVLANCLPVSKPLSYSLISQLFQLPWARKRLPPFSFPRHSFNDLTFTYTLITSCLQTAFYTKAIQKLFYFFSIKMQN